MKKFNKPYDISKVIIPVSDLKIVDPGTAITKSGDYLTLSNYSIKRLAALLNMGSGQFTKKLHSLEPSIWSQFLQQRLSLKDIQEILSHNNAVVIDDTLVTIGEGDTHVEDVVSSINDYINDESLSTSYLLYEKELLVVISVNSEGYGVLIKYYYQDNWVTIHDCYYNPENRTLMVSPYKELDTKVGEDISLLMEKQVIISTATQTMPYQIESYEKKMSSTFMSVDEVVHYMKKVFKIKMTIEPINVYDYAADNDDISANVLSKLELVLNKFYSQSGSAQLVHAPYLKRATTITNVTYADFSELLESMFLEENERVHIYTLLDFQNKAIDRDTHYDSLQG